MLYLNLPIVFILLSYGLNKLIVDSYETYEIIGLIFSLGILLATNAINVAHELGHRKNILDRNLSKLLFLPCLYMHFYLEHNLGYPSPGHNVRTGDILEGRISESEQ